MDTKKPYIYLDACTNYIQVGIWCNKKWLAHTIKTAPAINTLLVQTKKVLAKTGFTLKDLYGFIYNEGIGETLGIQLTFIVILMWRSSAIGIFIPIWTVRNLPLAAAKLFFFSKKKYLTLVSNLRCCTWSVFNCSCIYSTFTKKEIRTMKDTELIEFISLGAPCYFYRNYTKNISLPIKIEEINCNLYQCPDILAN